MALLRLGWNSHNKPRKKRPKKNKTSLLGFKIILCWPRPDVQFSNPINRRTFCAEFPSAGSLASLIPALAWTDARVTTPPPPPQPPPPKKDKTRRAANIYSIWHTQKNVIHSYTRTMGKSNHRDTSDFVNRGWFRSQWRMNNTYQVGWLAGAGCVCEEYIYL